MPGTETHLAKRASQYANLPQGQKNCASGLQDWFSGVVFGGACLVLRNQDKRGTVTEIRTLIQHSLTLSNTNNLGLFGLANQYLQFAESLVRAREALL
jgi:hypothetical protein